MNAYLVQVVGTFAVFDETGAVVMPSGRKERALIALLSLSPGLLRSKSFLKATFWPDSDTQKSSTNLRQTLSRIRKAYGTYCPVQSDSTNIWLDKNITSVAMYDQSDDVEILDGMDIGEEEFEDWLRAVRRSYTPATGKSNETLDDQWRILHAQSASAHRETVLSFDVTAYDTSVPGMRSTAEDLHHSMVEAALTLGSTRIVTDSSDLPNDPTVDVLVVKSSIFWSQGTDNIVLRCFRRTGEDIVWSKKTSFEAMSPGSFRIGLRSIVDAFADFLISWHSRLRGRSGLDELAKANLWIALDGLVRPGTVGFDDMRLAASSASNIVPSAVHRGVNAALHLFQYGERLTSNKDAVKEAADQLRVATDQDPSNGLIRALRGHSNSFYLKDFSSGLEHTRLATQLAPWSSLCFGLRALSLIYADQITDATKVAQHAVSLASTNSSAPFFRLILGNTLAISGDAKAANNMSKFSASDLPGFRPSLLLAMASESNVGNIERAHSVIKKIQQHEPDFCLDMILDPDYPIVGQAYKNMIVEAAKCLGVK